MKIKWILPVVAGIAAVMGAQAGKQVATAKKYCATSAKAGVYPAGCPVQYSRDAAR